MNILTINVTFSVRYKVTFKVFYFPLHNLSLIISTQSHLTVLCCGKFWQICTISFVYFITIWFHGSDVQFMGGDTVGASVFLVIVLFSQRRNSCELKSIFRRQILIWGVKWYNFTFWRWDYCSRCNFDMLTYSYILIILS